MPLLQISAMGAPGTQAVGLPGVEPAGLPPQAFSVFWQAPTPQVIVPRTERSSVVALQSSSSPLQDSVLGRTSPVHGPHTPPTQYWIPALQTPTPAVPAVPL